MGKPSITMRTTCLIVLISIASCVCCYPSKPLNERSTELAWQAWLLVDQSNKQADLGVSRRKITPKSVFIAPSFSIESLPACAEGYKSDPMGRCVKIFKLNESIHLDFVLESLSARFPAELAEEVSTTGPLQLNVPLDEDDELVMNETEMAIVVTPASSRDKTTSVKVDAKRHNAAGDKFDVEDIAAILRVKPESVEMTTIAELTTTMTTMRVEEETTTVQTTTETSSTTTEEMSTVPDAIFFRVRV